MIKLKPGNDHNQAADTRLGAQKFFIIQALYLYTIQELKDYFHSDAEMQQEKDAGK